MKTFLISLLICCFATTVSAQAGYYVGGRYVMPHGVALTDPVPGFGAAIGFANHLEVSDAFQLLYRGEANTLAASYNFFDYMNPQKAPILQQFRWYSFSAGFSPAVVVGEDIKVFGGIEVAYVALATGPISDGIFYPGIVLFDHVHGRIREYLGDALPMYIAIFDVGGEIDTLHFNKRHDLKQLNLENGFYLVGLVKNILLLKLQLLMKIHM